MKKTAIILVVALVLVAALFWWFSPAQMLKRRTASLIELMNLSGAGEARVMEVNALSGLLAEDVVMELSFRTGLDPVVQRDDIVSGYVMLSRRVRKSRFELLRYESIRIDGDAADVEFTMKGLVELPEIRILDGEYRMVFHWLQQDGDWRLSGLREITPPQGHQR